MRYYSNTIVKKLLELLKEHPYLLKALKEGKAEIVIRRKPRLTIYIRRKPKRRLHYSNFFMAGIYSELKGIKGKAVDPETGRVIPLSALIAKLAYKYFYPRKLKEEEPVKISINPKVLEALKKLVGEDKRSKVRGKLAVELSL